MPRYLLFPIAIVAASSLTACNLLFPNTEKMTEENPPPATEESAAAMAEPDNAMPSPQDEPAQMAPSDTDSDDAMMDEPADSMREQPGTYTAYEDGVIGNGEESVLFFHATWCPYCKKADAFLQGWYPTANVPVTTYKVDYDTSSDLKSRYSVIQQHTFVRIDGQGNKISVITSPSDVAVKTFLQPS